MARYRMSHHDHDFDLEEDGWTPKGASETFGGYKVWDHGVYPTDINHGEQDPDSMQIEE